MSHLTFGQLTEIQQARLMNSFLDFGTKGVEIRGFNGEWRKVNQPIARKGRKLAMYPFQDDQCYRVPVKFGGRPYDSIIVDDLYDTVEPPSAAIQEIKSVISSSIPFYNPELCKAVTRTGQRLLLTALEELDHIPVVLEAGHGIQFKIDYSIISK